MDSVVMLGCYTALESAQDCSLTHKPDMSCQLLCCLQRVGFGLRLSVTLLQGEAEDERAETAAQEEAVAGVEREVALLHTRLRLLAHHALVRPAPCHPQPLLLTILLPCIAVSLVALP